MIGSYSPKKYFLLAEFAVAYLHLPPPPLSVTFPKIKHYKLLLYPRHMEVCNNSKTNYINFIF